MFYIKIFMNVTFLCDKLKFLLSQQVWKYKFLLCIIIAIYSDSVEESPAYYVLHQELANIFCEGLNGVNILGLNILNILGHIQSLLQLLHSAVMAWKQL